MMYASRDGALMLLARPRRFNGGWFGALALLLAVATPAAADEIRKWRDAEGRLHVEIVGEGEPVDPDAAGLPLLSTTALSPDEKFSVATSHRRREIEKGIEAASAEIARLGAEIETTADKRFVVYTPPTARNPTEAQFLLDTQRNAFLAAQRFRQEQEDQLRKLRRERRRRLVELKKLWESFGQLDEDVRARYGKAPSWWRDRIDCEGCLTRVQVEAALAPDEDEEEDEEEPRMNADERR